MKQLIEDLISMMEYHVEQTRPIHTTTVALQAAREALKKLESQEPVACDCNQGQVCHICDPIIPPQRTWVGLTDEEAIEIGTQCQWYDGDCERFDSIGFARAIEAKLKEKNT
jgi:hypothetical protein